MSASVALLRKDLRLAAAAAMPALGALSLALAVVLFGHQVPTLGRLVWGSEAVPALDERIATFLPLLVGATLLSVVLTAVMVAHGDRLRKGAVLATCTPLPDALKIGCKCVAVLLVAAAGFGIIAATTVMSTAPHEVNWIGSGWSAPLAVALVVAAGAGLAAASMVHSVWVAFLLALALPFVGVPFGWGVAVALTAVPTPSASSTTAVPSMWRVAHCWEIAFVSATALFALSWVLVLAGLGARGLANRGQHWALAWRVGIALVVASAVGAATAFVIVTRDGSVAAIRHAIGERARAEQRAPTLSHDELLRCVMGQHDAEVNERLISTEAIWLLEGRAAGYLASDVGRPTYAAAYWPHSKSVFQDARLREELEWYAHLPYWLQIARRQWSEEFAASRMRFASDRTLPALGRLQTASLNSVTPSVPALAAVLVAAERDQERVVAIAAIAALWWNNEAPSSFGGMIAEGPVLSWCELTRRASEVLQSVLPGAIRKERAPIGVFPEALPSEEPTVRRAIAIVAEPLPRMADFMEAREIDRPAGHQPLPAGTLDCLRHGLREDVHDGLPDDPRGVPRDAAPNDPHP